MKAIALIEGASGQFGPEALKVIGQAFDEAWAQIACNFGGDPAIVESVRLSLASIILALATDDSRDDQALKNAAVQAIASEHRSMFVHRPGPYVSEQDRQGAARGK
jgi:hypothetical protein